MNKFTPRLNAQPDCPNCEGGGWLRNLFGARTEHCTRCKSVWRAALRAARKG